ncbi:hypothetical protein [Paenisporosarcina sp. OV554]
MSLDNGNIVLFDFESYIYVTGNSV